MKFGKEFRIHLEETLPEWRDKFLCYKPLKKLLKHIPTTTPDPDADNLLLPPPPPLDHHHQPPLDAVDGVDHPDGSMPPLPLVDLQNWFVKILSDELEKFNDFYVDKEEEFIIRLQVLSFLRTQKINT
uniref:SPX domain-containing protein n=1 Tax=Davidia involucrata TaxID=16924 RepID=A0A5B6YTX0_DAVIN